MAEKIKKSTGKFETCCIEAEQFLEIAQYCRDYNSKQVSSMVFPLFVNASLACELYLKAIALSESDDNTFYCGHDLKFLFEKISNHAQKDIQKNYEKKKLLIPLDTLLERYGDNFIKWRYAFEDGAEGNQFGIFEFAKAIHDYIEDMT